MKIYSYTDLRHRADAFHARVLARMRTLYREAGLPEGGFPRSAEAAAVAFSRGDPWPGIDYAKVGRFRYLERHRLYAAHRRLSKMVILGRTDIRSVFSNPESPSLDHASL